MEILLELIYFGFQNEILRKGYFPVNKKKFKEEADKAAADAALTWINKIRVEENLSKIIRVKYNNVDITDKVIDLDRIYD